MTIPGLFQVMRSLFILCISFLTVSAKQAWEAPGCHKLGFTRTVYIAGCVAFPVTTNACRGFCPSYAIPSSLSTLHMEPSRIITSMAECCSIGETHDVTVRVQCIDGMREFNFKSAKTCSCSVCRYS